MVASAVLAAIAMIVVIVGTTKFDTNSQSSRHAWKFIDFGAQVASVVVASELLRMNSYGSTAIAVLLIIVAAGVAYGHYVGSRQTWNPPQLYWNYLDGANYALWSVIIMSQLGISL
jgi:hypothetical protein